LEAHVCQQLLPELKTLSKLMISSHKAEQNLVCVCWLSRERVLNAGVSQQDTNPMNEFRRGRDEEEPTAASGTTACCSLQSVTLCSRHIADDKLRVDKRARPSPAFVSAPPPPGMCVW
jgi:hypothetical protein